MVRIVPHDLAMCLVIKSSVKSEQSSSANNRRLWAFLIKHCTARRPSGCFTFRHLEEALKADLGDEGASKAVSQAVELLRELWNVDEMMERIPQLGSLLQAPGPADAALRFQIHPSSVLGMHIRRCVASYTVMTYEERCQFFEAVETYCEGIAWRNDAMDDSKADVGMNVPLAKASLLQQLQDAQRGTRHASEPDIPDLAGANRPHSQYLHSSAEAEHSLNFKSAAGALHCYFDLNGQARRRPAPSGATRASPAELRAAAAAADALADSGRFQSGLVALAALHTRAGHLAQALAALHEAVRTAQQHNDAATLVHALAGLAWLLGRAPLGVDGACGVHRPLTLSASHRSHVRLLLQRCLMQATELQMPHLAAFAELDLARLSILHANPHRPPASHVSTVWSRAQHLGTLARAARRVAQLQQLTAAGTSRLLQAAAWQGAGNGDLAAAHALTHLACYADTGRLQDRWLAWGHLVAHAGRRLGYAAAEQVLHLVDAEMGATGAQQSQKLAFVRLSLAHSRAVARGDVPVALRMADRMAALPGPSEAVDIDFRVCAGIKQAEAVELLLLMGKMRCQAGMPAAGLPCLLSAQLHAEQFCLPMLSMAATIEIAEASVKLEPALLHRALADVQAVLPTVLSQGCLALQAQTHLALGRLTLLGMSREQLAAAPHRPLDHLRKAAQIFQDLDDWRASSEALYLAAMVYDVAQLHSQRNICAASSMRLQSLIAVV
ncbi:hypothetical protein WJX73_007338 [Symbiochloris irregularis]|uniref:Anaphase-promoting complex subunit 5 n=1 Tax=Symbiochloris irregularis TaxID=706552 RepID=A0AAW1NJP3_9CHLO